MQKKYTSFLHGFDVKGKRVSNVGEALVGEYKSPSTWTEDSDGEKMEGTPVQINTSETKELKVCPDGKVPDMFLYDRVSDDLTDLEWMTGAIVRDEVTAGDPVTCVIGKEKAHMETKLFADGYTPTVDDSVYVESGKYTGTDPLNGEGVSIGKIIEVDSDDEYAIIVLEKEIGTFELVTKVEKINITAPADDSEQASGFTLPANAIVKDVKVVVNTGESTGSSATLDVGTDSTDSGDADGFLAAVDVSSTGLVKGTLANGGQTLGALLYADEDGSGVLVPEDDIASGEKEVTYTAGSADFAELDADIYIFYQDLA